MEVAAGEQPCAGRQEGRKVHFAAEAPSPKGGPACTPGPAEDSWKVGAAGRWLPTAAACRGRRAPLQGRPHSLTPKRGPSQIAAGEASTLPPWSGTPLEDDCTPGSAAWLESARKVDDLRARLEGLEAALRGMEAQAVQQLDKHLQVRGWRAGAGGMHLSPARAGGGARDYLANPAPPPAGSGSGHGAQDGGEAVCGGRRAGQANPGAGTGHGDEGGAGVVQAARGRVGMHGAKLNTASSNNGLSQCRCPAAHCDRRQRGPGGGEGPGQKAGLCAQLRAQVCTAPRCARPGCHCHGSGERRLQGGLPLEHSAAQELCCSAKHVMKSD